MNTARKAPDDHYQTLEVKRTASGSEIKDAFRKLARVYHPDVNPDNQENERKFKEINAAYQVLSDPARRGRYDEQFAGREREAVREESRERAAWGELHRQEQEEMARERAEQEELRRRKAQEQLRSRMLQQAPLRPAHRAQPPRTSAGELSPAEARRRGIKAVRRWAIGAVVVIVTVTAATIVFWRLL